MFQLVHFRVLNLKHVTGDNVLFYNWYLFEVKNISSHTVKEDLAISMGFFMQSPIFPRDRRCRCRATMHPGLFSNETSGREVENARG